MATHATGTPAGICTMDSSESMPSIAPPLIGTPITGSVVWAATTPGSAADSPAPAMTTSMPRGASPEIQAWVEKALDALATDC